MKSYSHDIKKAKAMQGDILQEEKTMANVIVVANQKGGVGKTASASNLSATLAYHHHKNVLMIDLDGLASLTKAFGYDPDNFDSSIVTAIENPNSTPNCIYQTDIEGLSIIPSHPMLDTLELSLLNKKDKYDRLTKAIKRIEVAFDYIIIDAAPSLNTFFINALCAASYVIIPAETKIQSNFALEVFSSSLETMKELKNQDLKVLGVIATMYNCQANEDKAVLAEMQANYDMLGVIKRTTAVSSAVKEGLPCVITNRRSVASKEYIAIGNKIVNTIEG